MKNTIVLLISVLIVFLLAACGGGSANEALVDQSQESGETGFQGETSIESKLLYGSLMLEETDMAITPEQAEELLPLWKINKTLTESDTAADAEVDAIMRSIQDAMSVEQLAYIEALQLGPEEIGQMMEDLDIDFGLRGSEGEEGETSLGEFGGVPGQRPGGGQGGGPGGGDFQNLSPEQQETQQALREERGGGGRGFFSNPALFDALIEILAGKIE